LHENINEETRQNKPS
jgi:hypothetical protein